MDTTDKALPDHSHEELLAAWKRELGDWLAALNSRLAFPTARRRTRPVYPTFVHKNSVLLADQFELEAEFWVWFVPSRAASRQDWVRWLEALELLGLVATAVGKRVCWDLLIQTAGSASALRSLCWSSHDFHGMRPRFECRFHDETMPSDETMALVLDGVPERDHTPNYARVRNQLIGLSIFRACDQPVQLRFHFSFEEQTGEERAQEHTKSEEAIASGSQYEGHLHGLERVQTLATRVAARPLGRHSTWMEVVAFGLHMFCVYVPDDAREQIRAIASHVPMFWLAYGVSCRCDGIGNYYGRFLWRVLAPHVSRRSHLGLQRVSIHATGVRGPKQIIAFCSALAQSQTLQQFAFADHNDISETDSRVWASWLAFALFSDVCHHRIRTVILNVSERATVYAAAMNNVLQHPNPVAYLALLADGVDDVEAVTTNWPSTTIRLPATTRIYGSDLPTDSAATTLFHGRRDVECHVAGTSYGKFTRVLIPGVGFGCVQTNDVESTQPTSRTDTHPVRALSLCFKSQGTESIEAILRLVGRPLTFVCVRDMGKWENSVTIDAGNLLASSPNARHVCLDYLIITIGSLTIAKWGRELVSLALRWCRVVSDMPRRRHNEQPDMASRSLSVFPKLSSLYVCTGSGHHPVKLQDFLLSMDINHDLERFMVEANTPALRERYVEHTKTRDGQAIPGLLPRHKLAFLSVASTHAGAVHANRCQLNADTITHIFELAARSTHDRICVTR